MKKILSNNALTRVVAAAMALVVAAAAPVLAAGPTAVSIGTAESFVVLAGTGISNVPTSTITGDVGLSPAAGSNYSGLTAAQVTGTIYAVDGSGPAGSVNNPALLTTAKNDLTTAYIDAAGRTPTTTFVTTDNQLGGQTLTTGTYRFGAATTANITAASPLVLDAQGDPTAVFIFQATSSLVTASGSSVQLINGAQACNVFWQVGSSTTLGSSSTFKGTVMSLTASTINSAATIEGRILARNAAVTLNNNTITRPICAATSGSGGSGSGAGVPGLPNTGTQAQGVSILGLILPLGIVAASVGYMIRKQRV